MLNSFYDEWSLYKTNKKQNREPNNTYKRHENENNYYNFTSVQTKKLNKKYATHNGFDVSNNYNYNKLKSPSWKNKKRFNTEQTVKYKFINKYKIKNDLIKNLYGHKKVNRSNQTTNIKKNKSTQLNFKYARNLKKQQLLCYDKTTQIISNDLTNKNLKIYTKGKEKIKITNRKKRMLL